LDILLPSLVLLNSRLGATLQKGLALILDQTAKPQLTIFSEVLLRRNINHTICRQTNSWSV